MKRTAVVRRRRDVGYGAVLGDVTELLASARSGAARAVNAVMTATYWLVGRRIVEEEQRGSQRAEYGEQLLERLGRDLTKRFGRGFGTRNLFLMKAFFLSRRQILQTVSAELGEVMQHFPLPWSHYVRLLSVKNELARSFYESEALRGGWSNRQLDRQIQSQFYERAASSKNKRAMLLSGRQPESTPEDAVKEPFLLEFLDAKDQQSESALEDALVRKLEDLLLELGGAFTFVGRQRRLRVGHAWYRVDLLFFHRELRCLVIVDLKLGAFTHADAGQMHLYLNYAREHWQLKGENPPIGLILCAEKDHAVAKYALDGLPNKVVAAEYRTVLPDERRLAAQLRREQLRLTSHAPPRIHRGGTRGSLT